jgi:hypothetical protein
MKFILAIVLCAFVVSCGTGTVISFGKDGITIIPPAEPIIFPTK